MHQLILASQSPRRLELLQSIGIRCQVDSVKVSEIFDENLNLEAAVQDVARRKAEALVGARKYPKGKRILVLGADTVVVLDGRVLGKPVDAAEATEFLRLLSGKTHSVMSGVCLIDVDLDFSWTGLDSTSVRFRELTGSEMDDYVRSGEPMDKAGAYAIQGGARDFVAEYRGSWSNVVGLPLELLQKTFTERGWRCM
jgi:septum formation protein